MGYSNKPKDSSLHLESDIQSKYTKFLTQALDNVANDYYKIKTTYGAIVRERVFCYELYHQIRLIQKNHGLATLSFSAEIDKRGHHDIKSEDQKNPDFIFHQYGTFQNNEIVIEVKGKISRDIFKDLKTLRLYCERYQYKNAYFILYNDGFKELIDFIKGNSTHLHKVKECIQSNIEIICKKDANSRCEWASVYDLYKWSS